MPLTLIFYPSSPSVFLHPEEMHFKDIKAIKSEKSALWGVFSFYENWQKNIDGNWRENLTSNLTSGPQTVCLLSTENRGFFPKNLILLEEKTILRTAE